MVPVETIGLNSGMGFWTAVDVAGAKIRREGAFEYLLDLKLARENGVTSLPIYESGGAVAGSFTGWLIAGSCSPGRQNP